MHSTHRRLPDRTSEPTASSATGISSAVTGEEIRPISRYNQDHFQLTSSTSRPDSLRSTSRWSSPLEVTVSVDTGLNHADAHNSLLRHSRTHPSSDAEEAMATSAITSTSDHRLGSSGGGDDHQGILAVAIPPSGSNRTRLPSPNMIGRGLRHVTFSVGNNVSSPAALAVHQEPPSNSSGGHQQQQRRFARSFSYTPDLDSPGGASADHLHVATVDLFPLPPRSFRDTPQDDHGSPPPAPNKIRGHQLNEHAHHRHRNHVNQRQNGPIEERFVDGNYFFSQLDERREAEERHKIVDDFRRRQWRRRNVHGHPDDRLSTSLPVDYFQQPQQRSRDYDEAARIQRLKGDPTESKLRQFADGMELEIPIRWPTDGGRGSRARPLGQSISADGLQVRTVAEPAGDVREQYTKDYSMTTHPRQPPHRAILTDITATEGRYHVGTGHFHEFRPIVQTSKSRVNSPVQMLNRTWSNYHDHPLGDHRRLHSTRENVDRLSVSLDQGTFRRAIKAEVEEADDRRLQLTSSSNQLDRQSDNSLTVNRDESLGGSDLKVSPTGRIKAVSWRDQEPFQESPVRRQEDTDQSTTDDVLPTSLQNVSSHSYLDGSLSRSLQGPISQMENIDQFALFEVSTSFLGWGESFMGTSWIDTIKQYKFVVLNRYEEVLFFGIEEDSTLSNCNLGPHKSSFKVRILDASGRDVIQFRRLYPFKPAAKMSLGAKRKYRLEVSTSSGRVIGNVEKTFDSDSYYVLEDRAGECLFVVQRSCICTCPLFWDYEFKVLIPGTDTEVGEISWSYLTAHEEHFNGTEISFPVELEASSKIMLLGVCFLLNFSRWQSSYLESVYNPKKRGNRRSAGLADSTSSAPKAHNNSLSASEWRTEDQGVVSEDNEGEQPVQQNQIHRRN